MLKPFISIRVSALASALGLTLLLSVPASSSSSKTISEAEVSSHYVTMAHAVYRDSYNSVKDLQAAIETFLKKPTTDHLNSAKAAYKMARVSYQQSEIMRWDTDITLGTNTADKGISSVDEWEGQVNAWPLAEGLIDYTEDGSSNNIIASNDVITADYLIGQNGLNDNEANVATGIHAIEFLLWGQDLNGTQAGAGNRPASDYSLKNCTNGNCERRATYLRVATQLLVDDLNAMVAEWTPKASKTSGTLANNFLQSDKALAYILGSIKVMADDELAAARMGTALETSDPEEEHDCFSDLSHVSIYNNFQGIKNAFYGSYGNVDGHGVGYLLKQTHLPTYQKIDDLMGSIESKMSRIVTVAERSENPLKFDQIIALGEGNKEFDNANAASLELVQLGIELNLAREALSLKELNVGGGGDGD